MSKKALWTIILLSIGLANGFDKKGCNFNDAILNPKVFHNNACWKCYENLTDRNRLQKVYCLVEHDGLNFTVNGFLIRDRCIPFDYKSSSISELVQSSVSNEVYELWIKCCVDARTCCEKMIDNYQAENFFNSCDSHWDGYSCFDESLPGSVEKKSCPYKLKKNDDSKCEYSYTKTCQLNGTWTKSDFSQCYQNERLKNYGEWHIALLSISIVFCLSPILSPIVTQTFHSKHSKTLFALIVFVALRNILKLTTISMIFIDSSTPTFNSLGCRLMTSFTQFCNNMIYVCIALLALKLLQILKNTTENWGMFIMLSIGFILTCMSTILWSFMMKIYANKLCWLVDHENHFINDGFNFLLLTIAGVFFLLCLYHNSEKYDENIVHFLKIFIFPLSLFIAPFVLTLISSFTNCCSWEDFFNFLIIFIMLLQAISLCIIFFISPKSSLNHNHSYWSVTKFSTQNSNASLAPSSRDEQLNSWNDMMSHARHSVCYDNEVVNNSPEPYWNGFEAERKSTEIASHSRKNSRHTIRQVMLRAKNNHLGHIDEISPRKCSTPPLPKVIPNQILDDVQLFESFYRNLDSICITDVEQSTTNAADKRLTLKSIGKMFSLRNEQLEK